MTTRKIFEAMVRGLEGDAIADQVDAVLRGEFDDCNSNAIKRILSYRERIEEALPGVAEDLFESEQLFQEYRLHV